MSGICGIVNFDGKNVDPEVLHRMTELISYRGPDGINYWIEDNVGLAHLALNTTWESLQENQPLASKDEELILVADARVDNRNELIDSLKDKGYISKNKSTDADLILAAFECWGENCPKYIIGDFAFAVWDDSVQKLFIARDLMGMRQFFYSLYDNTLYFASAVQPIAKVLPKLPAINTKLIQDFLRRYYDKLVCQTIYKGILRLPPAHYLVVDKGSLRRKLYYIFGQEPKPIFDSDREWEEAFYKLLEEVLINQLRSIKPLGIWVSGGLDSSSLACQIYDMQKKYSDLPKIKFFSGVFDETPTADEKHFFLSVAEHCSGTPVKCVKCDDFWSFKELGKENRFPLDEPDLWEMRGYTRALLNATADEGCNVYITGVGSDDLLGSDCYYHPICLRDVKLNNWLQEAACFRQRGELSWIKLILNCYSSVIPHRIRSELGIRINRNDWDNIGLNKDYWPSNSNNCLLQKDYSKPADLDNSGWLAFQMLQNPWLISSFDMFGLMAANNGLELRQPYLDRRMIEFLIKIPSHLRFFKGVDRVLLRKIMKGKMPESVRNRRDKSSAQELYERGFQKEKDRIHALMYNSKLEKYGLINTKKLNEQFGLLLKGNYHNAKYLSWFIVIESWLREQEELNIEIN